MPSGVPVEKELSSALARELESRQVFVLPILYRDCQVPLFLKDKVYADFRTSYDLGLETLLERIDPPIKPQVLKKLTSGDPAIIAACFASIKGEHRHFYCDELVNMLASSSVHLSPKKLLLLQPCLLSATRILQAIY